jgi:hypothetical protein
MSEHYFIEMTSDIRFAVRAKSLERASCVFDSQKGAVARVKELNPNDNPDAERVLNVESGRRDKWRAARMPSGLQGSQ